MNFVLNAFSETDFAVEYFFITCCTVSLSAFILFQFVFTSLFLICLAVISFAIFCGDKICPECYTHTESTLCLCSVCMRIGSSIDYACRRRLFKANAVVYDDSGNKLGLKVKPV